MQVHVLQEYFGACPGENELTKTELQKKDRSLVGKLRLISDSNWTDEISTFPTYSGWGEVARGWLPTKPIHSKYTSLKTNRNSTNWKHPTQDELYQREDGPLQLKWRDIVKYSSHALKPNQIPNPVTTKPKSKLLLKVEVKLDRKRLEKMSVDHEVSSNRSFKTEKIVPKKIDLKGEKRPNKHASKLSSSSSAETKSEVKSTVSMSSVFPTHSEISKTKKINGWAKFISKLPRLNQQIKEDNKLIRRLSSRTRSREKARPSTLIELDYGTTNDEKPNLHCPFSENLPNYALEQKNARKKEKLRSLLKRREHIASVLKDSKNLEVGDGGAKKEMENSHFSLHVVLPSITDKPKESGPGLQRESTVVKTVKHESPNTLLSERNSLLTSPIQIKPEHSENSRAPEKQVDKYYDWKFSPFLPPILDQNDSSSTNFTRKHTKVSKKHLSNMIAITQGTIQAGITSNSIHKLQRTTAYKGLNGTQSLSLTSCVMSVAKSISKNG